MIRAFVKTLLEDTITDQRGLLYPVAASLKKTVQIGCFTSQQKQVKHKMTT